MRIIFILAVLLFLDVAVWAADYTISTTTAAREAALQAEATQAGVTAQQALQFFINNALDQRIVDQRRNRADRLASAWDKISAADRKTILDILAAAEAAPPQ